MKVQLCRWHLIGSLLLTLALPLASQAQYIPPVPPPTPVDGSKQPAYQPVAPKQRTCTTRTIRSVCGTEKVCQELKGRGMQCWTQEKYCDKSIESCN
jgi:hypothetical protein